MAEIRPFRGLRYSEGAGPLRSLVAPPYDVLSPRERDEYASRSPHNVVHLTLPEQRDDDRSKFVKYARSAATLSEWRREGALQPEGRPALYRYTQTFRIPRNDAPLIRTSLIALIKTEPYEKGVVLPHEQTFPKHKEDRLRILEATRAHLECIFGLFEDPGAAVLGTIRMAPTGARVETDSDEGVHHVLEAITDPGSVNQLVNLVADKKVWIADGHHRYETARAFREGLGQRDGPQAEDYMMMALSSMSDDGLVLLPTHRVLERLPYGHDALLEKLSLDFHLKETHSSRLMEEIAGRTGSFGLALPGGRGFLMNPKDAEGLRSRAGTEGSEDLRRLDVTLLHRVVFEALLGITQTEGVAYTRDAHEAVRAVDEGASAAFLMNPPTVDDMKRIALSGEKMPQKSTYYYPKVLSGLVLWSLNDFDA